MSTPRVIACKQRAPSHKKNLLERTDGFVYVVEFPETDQPARMILLLGQKENLFDDKPILLFLSHSYIEKIILKAKKCGNNAFRPLDALCDMEIDRPASAFTKEAAPPELLEALQKFNEEKPQRPPSVNLKSLSSIGVGILSVWHSMTLR